MEDKLELLRRVPLFASCDDQALEEIAKIVEEIQTRERTVLTHEGRQEGHFFIVLSGSVRINRDGRTINMLGPGDFLGEIALLDGGPRTATAITEEPTTLLAIRNAAFHQLLDRSTSVRVGILEAAGARMREMDSDSVI
jgi:CRP/FNR family transcriptional regulator, cyclic AMP receptor protein